MFSASISSTLAWPTAQSQRAMTSSAKAARRRAVSFLESFRPSGMQLTSRITAAAVTGPASGPRPTSSTPAT